MIMYPYKQMSHSTSSYYFSMNKKFVALALAAILSFVFQLGSAIAAEEKDSIDVPFSRIENGSIRANKQNVVIRSKNELESFWKANESDVRYAPIIDFSKEMMVGVFLGIHPLIERPRFSSISIKYESGPNRIDVTYWIKEWNPESHSGPSLPSMNSNHALFLIPKSDLPVNFIEVLVK